ncbi:MAG: hypothetical protein MJ016_07120 [Victivallaceae bacterium]|nr:hypothetical protein [Victivallaceae bacterium]
MLAPRDYDGIENACFADSAVVVGGTTAHDIVGGLMHLEGQTVSILADGAEYPSSVVSGGTVQISPPAQTVVVGLPFTSYITLNGFESETRNGSTFLQKKHVSELRISMYDSVGGEARAGDDEFQEIISRDVLEDRMDCAISPRLSVATISVAGGIDEDTIITIRQCAPLPMNIGAVVAEVRLVE